MSKCDTCRMKIYDISCGGCVNVSECKNCYSPPTNADRIRAMSDEELAEFLYTSFSCYGCPVRAECDKTACKGCDELVLEWLKQPVKEDA